MSKKFILIILTIFSLSTLPEYIHGAARSDNVFSLKAAIILSSMISFSLPLVRYLKAKDYQSKCEKLTRDEEYYCEQIVSKYKLRKISLLKDHRNDAIAEALFSKAIIFSENFFKSESPYGKEYILLHEYGHIYNNFKFLIKQIMCAFIFNLILFKTIKYPKDLKSFIKLFFKFAPISLILKILITDEENQADRFALNRLNYNDNADYERVIDFYNLKELSRFKERFKFLLALNELSRFKSPILKRFLWFIHSNYIFPPDAIKILQDKLRHNMTMI